MSWSIPEVLLECSISKLSFFSDQKKLWFEMRDLKLDSYKPHQVQQIQV